MRKVDKLLTMLTSFGCDRWVHLVVCLVASWVSALLFRIIATLTALPTENVITGLAGVVAGTLVAVLKEVYDYKTEELFDSADFSAGLIGVALFYAIYVV